MLPIYICSQTLIDHQAIKNRPEENPKLLNFLDHLVAMAQYYRYGNESESQGFSSYTENQRLASGQSYYTNPAVGPQYYGHSTNPSLGYNHNLSTLPARGYQQAPNYSSYGTGTNTNLTQSYGAPVTGYHGKHHESHVKKTFRNQKYRDGFSSTTVEYSSESESDDEGRVRRSL